MLKRCRIFQVFDEISMNFFVISRRFSPLAGCSGLSAFKKLLSYDGKDQVIGHFGYGGCAPGAFLSKLFDDDASLVDFDALHLVPGEQFTSVGNALLINAEASKVEGLPALQGGECARNQFLSDASGNGWSQLCDVLDHISKLDLVAIGPAQGVEIGGADVDAVLVAACDALPDFGDMFPGQWLELIAQADDETLLEEIDLLTCSLDDEKA